MWSASGRSEAMASAEWRAELALSRMSRPEWSSKVESRMRTWWCAPGARRISRASPSESSSGALSRSKRRSSSRPRLAQARTSRRAAARPLRDVDGEILAVGARPLHDGHGVDGKEPADGGEDPLVAVDARAAAEARRDLAHDVELAVPPRDLGDAALHRREAADDEGSEHDREEREEHAGGAVDRVDEDLEDDDRGQQQEGRQLEQGDLEQPLARRHAAELEIGEDQRRVDEEEDEQDPGGERREPGPAAAGGVERVAEERRRPRRRTRAARRRRCSRASGGAARPRSLEMASPTRQTSMAAPGESRMRIAGTSAAASRPT